MNRTLSIAALGIVGYLAYRALKPRYDFRNKHVLITGGARGLGLVLARRLVAAGARITICSRDANELRSAQVDLVARGGRVIAPAYDVTDPEQVRQLVAHAQRGNGPIDVLVNNAGVIRVGPDEEMREVDFRQSIDTHFWAAWHLCRELIPEMKRRGGRIVNVASFGGKVAVPHMLPYSTGKFALVGFSTGLRAELAEHGVVVTTVSPGLMRTGSHLHAEFKGRHEEEYAWFALGNGLPGFSMSAETAARRILAACSAGDAELVLGLPAKLGTIANAVCPNLTADLLAAVNRWVLPEPGGIGPQIKTGEHSRGLLPSVFTTLSDRAAVANNETATTPT